MTFLREKGGTNLVEYIVGGALVIAVVGIMLYRIATTTQTEGGAVNTWIDGINVPAAP